MTGGSRSRIRAIVVDDEALSRTVVREHAAGHPDVEIEERDVPGTTRDSVHAIP